MKLTKAALVVAIAALPAMLAAQLPTQKVMTVEVAQAIAQEKPACFRSHLWSYPVLLHGTHGCDRQPAFPAPSILQGGGKWRKTRGAVHREDASARALSPDK